MDGRDAWPPDVLDMCSTDIGGAGLTYTMPIRSSCLQATNFNSQTHDYIYHPPRHIFLRGTQD